MDNTTTKGSLQSRLLHFVTHGSSLSTGKRRALYLVIAMAALTLIWLPVGAFLSVKQTTYTSRWDLILPGAGAGLAVSLESVGQASATAASPYNSHSVDPKVNYKAIATSSQVLKAAAAQMAIPVKQFGKPKIKLVDQTALMHFSISAPTAAEAHCKAMTLHKTFITELERLRNDELEQREAAVNRMLQGYNESLRQAQQRILDYQAGSRIISLEQFNELTMNLERMRVTLRELKAEHAKITGNIASLQYSLDTNPRIAGALHTLQQDALFQELADKWAKAATTLSDARSKWGSNHPDVVTARDVHNTLQRTLHKRANKLVPNSGMAPDKLVALGTSNASLYTQLVELSATEQGLREQIDSITNSVAQQQAFIEGSTTDASNLEDLKRKHQVATAVLTTALAKLDIGKSDHFSAYPLLQMLAEPTFPDKPDTMARNLAILGGLFATMITLLGLIILWFRKPYLQRLLKSA